MQEKARKARLAWLAAGLYVAALHAVLVFALLRPDFIAAQHWRFAIAPPDPPAGVVEMQGYLRAIDAFAEPGRAVLIGDSHFQRMDAALLARPALNFGAGGDTLRNMERRVREYRNLGRASAILIWGGVNDLQRKRSPQTASASMEKMLAAIETTAPIFIIAVPPVDSAQYKLNQQIKKLNMRLAALCKAGCHFIDVHALLTDENGGLSPKYDAGDGVHLNMEGYQSVAEEVNRALTEASAS